MSSKDTRLPGLTLRLPPEIRDAAKKMADDERRSVTSLAEYALVVLLKEKGYLPK